MKLNEFISMRYDCKFPEKLCKPAIDYYCVHSRGTRSLFILEQMIRENDYTLHHDEEAYMSEFATESVPELYEAFCHAAYVDAIQEWRKKWRTKTRYLSICGCRSMGEAVHTAIHKAHESSVKHALHAAGRSTARPRAAAKEYLAAEIMEKLQKEAFDREEYDNWSKTVCERVRQIYRDHAFEDYTYGNAQKLLNMSIKYTLSADNIDPALSIFEVAHIPIDSVIMKIAKKKLGVSPMPSAWSKTDNMEDILSYEKRFREALPEGYTPLRWECENWKN